MRIAFTEEFYNKGLKGYMEKLESSYLARLFIMHGDVEIAETKEEILEVFNNFKETVDDLEIDLRMVEFYKSKGKTSPDDKVTQDFFAINAPLFCAVAAIELASRLNLISLGYPEGWDMESASYELANNPKAIEMYKEMFPEKAKDLEEDDSFEKELAFILSCLREDLLNKTSPTFEG